MSKLQEMQSAGRIKIASFDRAGTSTASEEDADAFAAAVVLRQAALHT
jgi:hypothetical protein